MAKKQKNAFDSLFTQLQVVDGNAVLFDIMGSPSIIMQITNPVQRMCTDKAQYILFHEVLANIVQTVGEGYAIQKQDIFCRQEFSHKVDKDAEFLTKSYFAYFEGREYTEIKTYLIITQEPNKSKFVQYDAKKWIEFNLKISKVMDILTEKKIEFHQLSVDEINEYIHRFMAFNFKNGPFSMNSFKASDEHLRIGDRVIKSMSLVDIDEFNMPGAIKPYLTKSINGYPLHTDLFGFFTDIPYVDCVIYNQMIQVPNQRALLRKLQLKAKRHLSMPDASNKLAAQDIQEVLDVLAADSKMMVNCNFNIILSSHVDKMNSVTSFVETKLFEAGILPSRSAYNQMELFINSFPGNAFRFNPEYDLFLTLSEAALCMFFKEHLKVSENTPLKTYYTDRQGLPVCIDITGKEGSVKYTDNANFFCIGPSGSGKSFHMNSVVRQLLEQGTDVVMVDTGDSYEGICGYFKGTYISYSKEKPISMNPFKITQEEYTLNFGEKKNFLKNLIFLIFKGDQLPDKVEEDLINQTLVEYYESYFNKFEKFNDAERQALRDRLLLSEKTKRDYKDYSSELENIDEQIRSFSSESANTKGLLRPADERRFKLLRQCSLLVAKINDKASTPNEIRICTTKLSDFKKELVEDKWSADIEQQIDHIEEQKRRLQVQELSFNSYYKFALERIPQIMSLKNIRAFNIDEFSFILEKFYKGGELEHTLNSDLDVSLFDEKFIVFEIDKIKDDPVLFPIVVLIIMDVFLQKMRIKKGRKALIIEEAWKAIASPTMAEYIKYLYKTVRKFHGIAGVVTQELNDVIDSPIVKEAIINNSDVKILLDQTKFKDRYDDIAKILGLTDVQKQQIFTVNSLENKEGRNYFKEVWICRGQQSDVFGVEEPPECYWAYTTERSEKEALKIYIRHYGNIQKAIHHIELDRNQLMIPRYFDFAAKVNKQQKVMSLWEN